MKKTSSRTVIYVMIITLFARFFGLLREVLMARYYGASMFTDAYIIANNVPTVLFDTLGQALLTCFIPMYTKITYEKDRYRANLFSIRLLVYLILICGFLTIIGEAFTKPIVLIFASGFKGDVLRLTIEFTRILFPSLFAMTILNLYTGYLQIYQKFEITAVVPMIGNLVIIITLIISNFIGNIYIFVWGSLFGLFFQVLFLIPSIINVGFFDCKNFSLKKDRYVLQLIPLLIPVFIGSALNEINSIVDRTMVSNLETGSVSTLNYAYKIISLALTVIAMPVINVMYTRFSEYAATNDNKRFKGCVEQCLNYNMIIMIPVCLGIFIFRGFIIKILFERGSFDTYISNKTSQALACYTVGLLSMCIQQVFIRAFYSKQNTFIPMINGIICTILNIILDFIMIKMFNYKGAAIATSITAIISSFLLFYFLWKLDLISSNRVKKICIKNFVSGMSFYFTLKFLITIFLKGNYTINLLTILLIMFTIVLSTVIYLLVQLLLKNEDILKIVNSKIKYSKV